MKTARDPRHLRRIAVIRELFSWEFNKKSKLSKESKEIIASLDRIDKLIAKSAPGRPLEQINKIDLAILRLAIFELIIDKGEPPKVVVDEAIELGKEFGSDSSSSFINGALGQVIKLKEIKV